MSSLPISSPTITTETRGHVLLIGFNRPEKLNAFHADMLRALGEAYTAYESNDELRCAVVFAHGQHFTAGLDLANVAPLVASGQPLWPAEGVDPWGLEGRTREKPVVVAMQGRVYTLGIELALASDVRLCADDATFAQLEIARGIFPFGGATFRAPAQLGWGNAMRFLLTAEPFGAPEALRIGLVQEVIPAPALLERAVAIATTIAAQAPLGVRATLASARLAEREDEQAAARHAPRDREAHGERRRARGPAVVPRAKGRPVLRPLNAQRRARRRRPIKIPLAATSASAPSGGRPGPGATSHPPELPLSLKAVA